MLTEKLARTSSRKSRRSSPSSTATPRSPHPMLSYSLPSDDRADLEERMTSSSPPRPTRLSEKSSRLTRWRTLICQGSPSAPTGPDQPDTPGRRFQALCSPRAMCSATMIVARLVVPVGMVGIIDASATVRASIPCTVPCASVTAPRVGSDPMAQVPTG
jgi:hypothetical protein